MDPFASATAQHQHRMSFNGPSLQLASPNQTPHSHFHQDPTLHHSPTDDLDLRSTLGHRASLSHSQSVDLTGYEVKPQLTRQNSDGQQNGAKRHKRRKLSQAVNRRQSSGIENGGDIDGALLDSMTDGRGGSPPQRKQRACDQCKQQKLKCNLVEDPFQPCDRCVKFKHPCQITDDFKRVAKRTQLADLERQNDNLINEVAQLKAQLRNTQSGTLGLTGISDVGTTAYPQLLTPGLAESALEGLSRDQSQDAQLLLQLKQGQGTPALTNRQDHELISSKVLGHFVLTPTVESECWRNFFSIYHYYLPVIDDQLRAFEQITPNNRFLFWTIMIIALRHYTPDVSDGGAGDNENNVLFHQLLPEYRSLLDEAICKPPKTLLTVKGLCLICNWPLPVSNTEEDVTQVLSGVMMKHATQLGLHRPSNPDDFSRSKLKLQRTDIKDRLRTWAACTLVAQNISTGFGQPPDTVYDATLSNASTSHDVDFGAQSDLHLRMEIEKLANEITRNLYLPNELEASTPDLVEKYAAALETVRSSITPNQPLDMLYCLSVCLHLRLHVFFDKPTSEDFEANVLALYSAAGDLLNTAFSSGIDLRHAPNYIMQIMLAAAAALMKMLSSPFSEAVQLSRPDIEGATLFWRTITEVRRMTVVPNDLPLRLAEVFAQMGKASGLEMIEAPNPFEMEGQESNLDAKPLISIALAAEAAAASATTPSAATNTASGVLTSTKTLQSDMTLKRKARQSMSVFYDSIWRWKEDMAGQQENLELTINKNPTSPQQTSARPGTSGSTTHRGSMSIISNGTATGRRPSDLIGAPGSGGPAADLGFQGMFSGFEGYSEFELFDPLAWALQPPFYAGNATPEPGLPY